MFGSTARGKGENPDTIVEAGNIIGILEKLMVVPNCLRQKLSDVFSLYESTTLEGASPHCQQNTHNPIYQNLSEQLARLRLKAQGEWFSAIASLENLLLATTNPYQWEKPQHQGILLTAPTPVLSHSSLIPRFLTGIFNPEVSKRVLMPCQAVEKHPKVAENLVSPVIELPLFPKDPLFTETFCLVMTAKFGLLMVLGEDRRGMPEFQFSFDPEIVQQAWEIVRSRLVLTNYPQLSHLDELTEQFAPPLPDYRLVTRFSQQLLKNLPDLPALEGRKPRHIESRVSSIVPIDSAKAKRQQSSPDIELLQALTHEIRTPLTTIRTMTRLLLKRKELTPEVVKRLEVIDNECTEQINRMELIFKATEMEVTPGAEKPVQLVPISLDQVLQQSISRWVKQAQRRNVILDVALPKKLPQIVSDPAMLEQILTGLMEKFTRSLPTGGHIQVQVTTAGHQLKLQFQSQTTYQTNPFKALGQLLLFQPETGNLSLNLDVTKNLFHALGGKLIVRHKPLQGEVLTIFLPLGGR